MVALDFPNAPANGQVFAAPNGVTYQWNGTLWTTYGGAGSVLGGISTPTYDASSVGLSSGATFWAGGDTAMQITNGVQLFNRAFTALTPANPIEVEAQVFLQATNAIAAHGIVGLFIDGAASALAQGFTTCAPGSGGSVHLYWQGVLAAGLHTFMLRLGSLNSSGIYTNMSDAGHAGGGAQKNTMVIREVRSN